MAKVNVVGKAMVLTSSVKLEDFKKVEKYRPGALTLKEKIDEVLEPIFAVTTDGEESISKYGVCFGSASRDGGYAQITLGFDTPDETTDDELKKLISDKFGVALVNLNKVEDLVPALLLEIDKEAEVVGNMIEFA